MPRNPGQIYEITEGKYKGNFFDVRNKEQLPQFSKENKAVGKVCKDRLGTNVIAEKIIISASKLIQVGFID